MPHFEWFDTNENKALLAVCARRMIRGIGIGGIIWGIFNMAGGVVMFTVNPINIGIFLLGLAMFIVGILSLKRPTHGKLLAETYVCLALFLWNVGIFIYSLKYLEYSNPGSLIFPLIITIVFANSYKKLKHVKDEIAGIDPALIASTKQVCKTLRKARLKNEPNIIQTHNGRCRIQLLEDKGFFVQLDLTRAFTIPRSAILSTIEDPDKPKWKMKIQHPLSELTYHFDKKNTEKLKGWTKNLTAEGAEDAEVM